MASYVAFLRGINVGGRNIKMADIKLCFEKAGFCSVSTVLQTGNILFETQLTGPDFVKHKIESELTKTFNFPAIVQVLTIEELSKIVKGYPFQAKDGWHSYVIFLENDLEVPLVAEAGQQLGEKVKAGQGVVYWQLQRGNNLKSPFAKLLTKSKYKDFNTTRNLNTLLKILK